MSRGITSLSFSRPLSLLSVFRFSRQISLSLWILNIYIYIHTCVYPCRALSVCLSFLSAVRFHSFIRPQDVLTFFRTIRCGRRPPHLPVPSLPRRISIVTVKKKPSRSRHEATTKSESRIINDSPAIVVVARGPGRRGVRDIAMGNRRTDGRRQISIIAPGVITLDG